MQQAAEVAIANGRKVALVGRSMRKNMNIARNLGYVDLPEDALVSPKEAMELPPDEVLVLCTGSQGEPMSALTRIAYGDHQNVTVERGDTVIISAKPVPGNELRVHDSINRLARAGAEVLHEEIATRARLGPCLLGGDADAALARSAEGADADPRRVPDARRARASSARDAGIPADGIVIAENGSVVELTPRGRRHRRPHRGRGHLRRRSRRRRRRRTSRCATAAGCRRTAC